MCVYMYVCAGNDLARLTKQLAYSDDIQRQMKSRTPSPYPSFCVFILKYPVQDLVNAEK